MSIQSGLIWKLKFDNGNISYLMGTMHVKDDIAFKLMKRAEALMSECSFFYAEMDLNQADDSISPESFLMPKQIKLTDYYSTNKLEKWNKYTNRLLNFDLSMWHRVYPIITVSKMAESLMSPDNRLSLDHSLFVRAEEMHMNVGGIESLAEQLETMKSLNLKSQMLLLKKTCENISNFKREIKLLKQYYGNQDILRLYNNSTKGMSGIKQNILIDRNKKMANFILDSYDKTSFFAVGAAHLAGFHGILRQLKKNDIQISRI